jgi:hypothetical protein
MTSLPPGGCKLHALIAAIRCSPIMARLRYFRARQWARIRRSPDADAFVLEWIASHVRERPRPPRPFM